MDSDQQFVICGAHCESVNFCESTRKHFPILSLSDICFISNGEINKITESVSRWDYQCEECKDIS